MDSHEHLQECGRNELINNSFVDPWYELDSEDLDSLYAKLSTEEILRIAGERYIQYSTHKVDGLSMFIHPYASSLTGLSIEQTKDMELVHLLLAAAEEVDQQQFHLASQSIARCLWKAY